MPAKVRLPDREALIVKEDALEVVGFGRNAYLWVGDKDGRFVRTVQGAELRSLFNAIRRAYTGKTVRENRRTKWPQGKKEAPSAPAQANAGSMTAKADASQPGAWNPPVGNDRPQAKQEDTAR